MLNNMFNELLYYIRKKDLGRPEPVDLRETSSFAGPIYAK